MSAKVAPRSHEGVVEANDKAIDYLQTIDFKTLGKTVFTDYLATVSEGGKDIGDLTISVEETVRNEELCYYIHAQSHGEQDGVSMGTSVTAYLTRGVVTLEQTKHEYVNIPDKPLDKKTILTKEGNQYIVRQIIIEGTNTTETKMVYPLLLMTGFVTEGANIMLERIMCLKQEVPEKAVFVGLDADINLAVIRYEKLPDSSIIVEGTALQVLGVQRAIKSSKCPSIWQTYFLSNGLMTSRTIMGSPIRMQLVKLPNNENNNEQRHALPKKKLLWQEDMKMHSHFLDRKEEIIRSHETYINKKPEIQALLKDFCQFVLQRKPDDVCSFAANYFQSFSCRVNRLGANSRELCM